MAPLHIKGILMEEIIFLRISGIQVKLKVILSILSLCVCVCVCLCVSACRSL